MKRIFFSSYLSIYPWLWDSPLKIPYFFCEIILVFFCIFSVFFYHELFAFFSRNTKCKEILRKKNFLESEQNEKIFAKNAKFSLFFFSLQTLCKLVDPHLNYCRLNYSSFELLFVLTKLIMTSFPVVHSTHYFLIWTVK